MKIYPRSGMKSWQIKNKELLYGIKRGIAPVISSAVRAFTYSSPILQSREIPKFRDCSIVQPVKKVIVLEPSRRLPQPYYFSISYNSKGKPCRKNSKGKVYDCVA